MTDADPSGSLAERIAAVRARIAGACARAGRDPAEVTLIAVSKMQPAAPLIEAWRAGVSDFGENYVQEALARLGSLQALTPQPPAVHFIGHLQTNKAGAAFRFATLQSVDSVRLLGALAAAKPVGPLPIFLHVNLAAEASKGGIAPDSARSKYSWHQSA